jgi:predicted oxidoreductase
MNAANLAIATKICAAQKSAIKAWTKDEQLALNRAIACEVFAKHAEAAKVKPEQIAAIIAAARPEILTRFEDACAANSSQARQHLAKKHPELGIPAKDEAAELGGYDV